MTSFAHPAVAIGFGAFVLCAETCLHFEDIVALTSWLGLPIHDWAAGLFLVIAGVLSHRNWPAGRPYQTAAWGFMLSLLFGAFVGHWEEWRAGIDAGGWLTPSWFIGILGGLTAIATAALVTTINRRT